MRGYLSVVFILFLLSAAFIFTACGYEEPENNSVGAYTEEKSTLEDIRLAAVGENPAGQEFISQDEGIYIMLPDSEWRLSSEEDGCIGFSDDSGLINIYYSDDDGSAYDSVPQNTGDVAEIMTNAGIPEEWFEIIKFDSSSENGVKDYSYTIRFNIPDEEGNYSEFYSISRSLCSGEKLYVAAGQIYDETVVVQCETALKSFAFLENDD
ncbi:MAG: hypothetical protein LUD81_02115 [Clostridiales bacterium]|nr:hypothetical protein [Clostridiales bacterium]